MSDLFPGVVLPTPDYKDLHEALAEAFQFYNLQNQEIFMTKTLQVLLKQRWRVFGKHACGVHMLSNSTL